MRTTASFKGHPLHAILIPFPIAFFGGAFAFDLAGLLIGAPALWTTGGHLAIAGIVMALLAAIPGAVDYFTTVPPRSSAKARASRHALVMLGVVSIFAVAWALRGAPAEGPTPVTLGLMAGALALLAMGGWMGGTLVYRNQIGVDHRYADAGRWSEERAEAGAPAVVARTSELKVNQMKLVHLDGRRIVLGRTEEGFVAFDDRCPHRGASLADGAMICGAVQCPWHGSQFDTRSGELRAGPAEGGIRTYEVSVEGEEVRVTV